jgi:hypothetical protein
MGNNSLIFMNTTTASSVQANGVIPLTNIARRRGSAIQNGTNSVILNNSGYYKITATITFTAPATGVVTLQAQKNGTLIQGMQSSTTITTATTEVRSLTISGIVRVFCNEGIATITLVDTGVAINTSNVSLDIEYLG